MMELCYPRNKEELKEHLGEAFHTAFRKATDAPEAYQIWTLISEMDENAWDAVLRFVMLEGYDYGLAKVLQEREELNKNV